MILPELSNCPAGGALNKLSDDRWDSLLVPNAGLLPKRPVFPKAPVVLVLGWPNALVVVVPVVAPNPVEPNAPVEPKPVAGLGAPNTLAVFEGV